MTRILVAQMNPTVGDLRGNTEQILEAIQVAKDENCSLVVTPELSLCGYPPNDLYHFPDFMQENEKALEKIMKASTALTVLVGCLRPNKKPGKPLFNSVAIIENEKLQGYYDKCLLPTYDVFDERRYFEPAHQSKVLIHRGLKIGLSICEDIWQKQLSQLYAFDPISNLASSSIDLLINLSSSPFEAGKLPIRMDLAQKTASQLGCPLLYCNQVGGNDDLIFDGSSFFMAPSGDFQKAPSFKRAHFIFDTEKPIFEKEFKYDKIEHICQALELGLHDFFHKQNFKSALIGLSGGIDSAVVATLAQRALGAKNVMAIAMPSRFSSESSLIDAKKLAHNLKIPFEQVPIEPVHQTFLDLLSPAFKDLPEDVTEENLQPRLRGMILMAYSNKMGHLVLTGSNKSELALGYATLYGDLAGALAPLSDLLKTQVYELAHYLNRDQEIIPSSILEKEPSAELKPGQKDSDTLPPYALLDRVLEEYVENHLSPQEIAKKHHLEPNFVFEVVRKIHRAEYKRRQAPLGLKVTSKAFSVGWRFPIVQKWA